MAPPITPMEPALRLCSPRTKRRTNAALTVDTNVRRLFGEAGEFGIERLGISPPVHGQNGDRALVSVTSDASDRDWSTLRLHYMRDFQLLALHMHQAILRLEGGRSAERASLSPGERECLQWIAEGKTYVRLFGNRQVFIANAGAGSQPCPASGRDQLHRSILHGWV